MTVSSDFNTDAIQAIPPASGPNEPGTQVLASLLEGLEETSAAIAGSDTAVRQHENQLLQVRLGIASSLFVALRAKNVTTAQHCLRVALGCASWSRHLGMTDEEVDEIEVAALLHDIGKIGTPDHILLKPTKLSPEEATSLASSRDSGLQILSACCASQNILDIVRFAGTRFNDADSVRRREDLPIGARILAIVDAYDAMTTDRVYRRAMSRERALAELFENATTQFDPQLVKSFCNLLAYEKISFDITIGSQWLQALGGDSSNRFWRLNLDRTDDPTSETVVSDLYHDKLLDSMHDGVVFVDNMLMIVRWNRATERLTGISGSSVLDKQWSPELVEMRDESGEEITQRECPFVEAIRSGSQMLRRLIIRNRSGGQLSVDVHMVPVVGKDGQRLGGALLLHDASSQISLEERVQTLHEKATLDPLTGVANRAEFDRVLEEFIKTHLEVALPCSLIIADIDHFKRINDRFGHPVGDEAIMRFAAMLRQYCRAGDLVARYGGEEFVMLCADCDNATATNRAEELREALTFIKQESLKGHTMTASFGVTELQAGDTPETMLNRADRALYMAKDRGRNRVVQLGSGLGPEEETPSDSSWMRWLTGAKQEDLLQIKLVTAVPLNVAAEKLKGFVADHGAEISQISENNITMTIDGKFVPFQRRGSDRPASFNISLDFEEGNLKIDKRDSLRTIVDVRVRPKRLRERRREDALARAQQLVASLKSYLMAQDLKPNELGS